MGHVIHLSHYRAAALRLCPECKQHPADRGYCHSCIGRIERQLAEHRFARARRLRDGVASGELCAACLEPVAPRQRCAVDTDTGEVFHASSRCLPAKGTDQ